MLFYYRLSVTFTTRYDNVRKYLRGSQGPTNSSLCHLCERVILFALKSENQIPQAAQGSPLLPVLALHEKIKVTRDRFNFQFSGSDVILMVESESTNIFLFHLQLVLVDPSFFGFSMF